MPIKTYDVAVIGAGPAGYTAAIRASQLGARVALIEQGSLGGACLNWACIPTKFFIHSTDIIQVIKSAVNYGISAVFQAIDWATLQERKNATISMLTEGLAGLLAANNIEVITGRASLTKDVFVEIITRSRQKTCIQAKNSIISTGSWPTNFKMEGVNNLDILHSQGLLGLEKLPQSLILIGGGAVGIEFATIFSRLGCQVSLIELMPHILPSEDTELSTIMERCLKRDGIKIYTSAIIQHMENAGHGKQVVFNFQGKETAIEAEIVAAGIGQKPYLEDLGLSVAAINYDHKGIKVDEHMATNISGVFAAGDVTGKIMLAHVAMAQGKIAAENAMGLSTLMDYDAVPRCVFSRPEFAAVGLTESEAKIQGHRVKCGRFPLAAASAAIIQGERRGLMKIVADSVSDKILGVHILSTGASNLIAEAALALQMGATSVDFEKTIHAHPTLSEALWDAALDISGHSINFKLPPK
jgi:dihydrolipoamide dehydrogenase